MSVIGKTLLVMLSAVEFLVGVFGNGFVMLAFSLSWVRNRKIFLVELILTGLALSRICFLWMTILLTYLDVNYDRILPSKRLLTNTVIVWTGSNYLCMGSTTCLSVFYFLKIGHFSNPVFLWMKQRIPRVLLTIVMGSVFHFSLLLIFIEAKIDGFMQKWVIMEKNTTFGLSDVINALFAYQTLTNTILVIFSMVSLTSLLLLIFSLWSHSRRMRRQGLCSRDSSTEAHVRAMKTMASSLAFFIMYYLSHLMMIWAYSVLDNIVAKIFAHGLIFLYPSCHPFLLILWNSKLKQAFLCVLTKLRYQGTGNLSCPQSCLM